MKKILLCFVILFSVCLPAISATTVIENYTPAELKSTLMKLYIRQGANIKNATDYQLVIDEKGNFWTNVFAGSNFNPYATTRSTYNFIQDNKNTIINLNIETITNPNSAFEHATPYSDATAQIIVDYINRAFNGYYGYGFTWKKHKKYLKVLSTIPDVNELKYSDKIYSINGREVKSMSKDRVKSELAVFRAGQELKLDIKNNDKEKTLILKSKFIEPSITKSN